MDLRPETMKVLSENTGETIQDIDASNDFLDRTSKVQEAKAKIDKRDYIKLKVFCKAINRAKRQ
jgi:hypothetical protein